MISVLGLSALLWWQNPQEAPTASLVQAWHSYRYAEFDARGGHNCDRRQQWSIEAAFDRHFGRRASALHVEALKQLGRAEAESEFDVIAICSKLTPTAFKDGSWTRARFRKFQTELSRAEEAFGMKEAK